MAFWGRKTWEDQVGPNSIVYPFRRENLDQAGYRLSIGEEVFVTGKNDGKITRLHPEETFSISPGQFAFILTDEYVSVPLDCIGFISVRASIKFKGLVNVSGFHVDPGYSGKLIFSVFNSGPSRITLRRRQAVFCIWMAYLDAAVPEAYAKRGYDKIPTEIVSGIDGNHLTAFQLKEQIDSLSSQITRHKYLAWAIFVVASIILLPLIPDAFETYLRVVLGKDAASETRTDP